MLKRRTLPKYVSEFRDRHGKIRLRFRRKGYKSYYFTAQAWSDAFKEEYHACLNGTVAEQIRPGSERIVPGSVSDLISRYYRSVQFNRPSAVTKHKNRMVLERFRAEHGHRIVAELAAEHVEAILAAKSETPFAADYLKKLLNRLMKYARKIRMRDDNPIEDVDSYNAKSGGFHTWTPDELARFEARHPIGSKARLAYALFRYTGQRRSDVVVMGPGAVSEKDVKVWGESITGDLIQSREGIFIQQVKTKVELTIPLHRELQRVLESTELGGETYLVTARGKPFSRAGFGNWFRDRCDEAGLKECSAHGLRKRAATDLAEAGCTPHQIMSICGFGLREAERYTRAVQQPRMARQAMALLEASDDQQASGTGK